MVHVCCVPNCTNRTKLHRFPNSEDEAELYKQWTTNIGRAEIQNMDKKRVYQIYRVCDIHFTQETKIDPNKFFSRSGLKKGACPTLHCAGSQLSSQSEVESQSLHQTSAEVHRLKNDLIQENVQITIRGPIDNKSLGYQEIFLRNKAVSENSRNLSSNSFDKLSSLPANALRKKRLNAERCRRYRQRRKKQAGTSRNASINRGRIANENKNRQIVKNNQSVLSHEVLSPPEQNCNINGAKKVRRFQHGHHARKAEAEPSTTYYMYMSHHTAHNRLETLFHENPLSYACTDTGPLVASDTTRSVEQTDSVVDIEDELPETVAVEILNPPTQKNEEIVGQDEELERRMEEAYKILQSSVQQAKTKKDELDIYGELVTSKLHKMDEETRYFAMNKINNILFPP